MTGSQTGQVVLSTSPQKVTDGDQNAPSQVYLYDDGAVDIFWGYKATVSAATGVRLGVSKGMGIPLEPGEAVYAVAVSGTPTVAYARSRALVRGS